MPLRWNKQLIVAYKNVFESPGGQRVLDDLRKRAPLLTNGVSGVSLDVNTLLVLEGQSNIVKHIYKMLERDPNEEKLEQAITKNDVI